MSSAPKPHPPKSAVKLKTLDFGHPPETVLFWRRLVREALSLSSPTPFYIFAAQPIAERIAGLDAALSAAGFKSETKNQKATVGVRHWLSLKTQPVAPLLRWWRRQHRGVEVVSEFELRAALAEGFLPENILVNGPAKHHWLPQFAQADLYGLAVNLDSATELAVLAPMAKKLNWRCGVRLNTKEEFDPESPQFPTQFGFTPDEAVSVFKKLLRTKVRFETVHFHLRSNLASAHIYERALAEVAEVCRAARFSPRCVDIGGGLPVRHVLSRGGKVFDGEFGLRAFSKMLRQAAKLFPDLRGIWLENGRFISASSGVLVIKILEVKARPGLRQLICDGGRTLNALTSLWEQHRILSEPNRTGRETLTAVHGPTCMPFDHLTRVPLPRSLRAGDHLIWFEAGAYHIPWETRFSHGHAAAWWHDETGLKLARERQSFENFWGQWQETQKVLRS